MKRKPPHCKADPVPSAVYAIATRRAGQCMKTASGIPSLTMEELVIGAYLQGLEDMGLAISKRWSPKVEPIPFEVM